MTNRIRIYTPQTHSEFQKTKQNYNTDGLRLWFFHTLWCLVCGAEHRICYRRGIYGQQIFRGSGWLIHLGLWGSQTSFHQTIAQLISTPRQKQTTITQNPLLETISGVLDRKWKDLSHIWCISIRFVVHFEQLSRIWDRRSILCQDLGIFPGHCHWR